MELAFTRATRILILSRINPISRIDTYFLKIHYNINLSPVTGFPKGLFTVGLPAKRLKTLLPSSILATLPAHLDLIALTILVERYKL